MFVGSAGLITNSPSMGIFIFQNATQFTKSTIYLKMQIGFKRGNEKYETKISQV